MNVLSKLTKEYQRDLVREEDGKIFEIDGEKYVITFENQEFIKNLSPIDDENNYFIKREFAFLGGPVYMCLVFKNNKYDYYYISESNLKNSPKHIVKNSIKLLLESCYDSMETDFTELRIIDSLITDYNADLDLEDDYINITKSTKCYNIEIGDKSVLVYWDENDAKEDAIQDVQANWIYDCKNSISKDEVERFRNTCSDDWIDSDAIIDYFKDYYIDYFKDDYLKRSDRGEHGCELYDRMIEEDVIEDSSDYFEIDRSKPNFELQDYKEDLIEALMDNNEGMTREEALEIIEDYDNDEFIDQLLSFGLIEETEDYFELDYSSPKFDEDEKIEEMAEKMKDDIDDPIDEYISNFGELYSSFYDLDKLAEEIVDCDGIAHFLSNRDEEGYEVEIDDEDGTETTYYCYLND